jgi:hypothetical protein
LVQVVVQEYQVENQVQDEHVCFASEFEFFLFYSSISKKKYGEIKKERIFSAVTASGGGNRRRYGRKFVDICVFVC